MTREPIREQWENFRKNVIPDAAPPMQIIEMRRAFYAGAAITLEIIETGLSEGQDVTAADEQLMIDVSNDLLEFVTQVENGVA